MRSKTVAHFLVKLSLSLFLLTVLADSAVSAAHGAEILPQPRMIKLGKVPDGDDLMETTPIIFEGRLLRLETLRPNTKKNTSTEMALEFVEIESGRRLGRFAYGYGLADALAYNGKVFVFASKFDSKKNQWGNFITVFESTDLQHWDRRIVFETNDSPNEGIFNVSVTRERSDGRWVMVYETNDSRYTPFTMKFAESNDLKTFSKMGVPPFRTDRYTGAPNLVWHEGCYYFFFAERFPAKPNDIFETHVARSKDLIFWEYALRPVLKPRLDELNNNSDISLLDLGGTVLIYYANADQVDFSELKMALFPGGLGLFLQSFFSDRGGVCGCREAAGSSKDNY